MTDSKKILAVCMSVVTATQVGAVALNQANADVSEDRISGLDRYETAADLAKQFKMAKTVVIASGENFADALCAAPLAKKNNAPIILVRKHSIDKKTISVLKQLKVKNAIIVGGENSISKKVASQIEINGIKIQRVAGEDRYKTSLNIAKEMGVFDEIAIANGGNFADALSISEIAAQKNMPILLTKKDKLDQSEQKYIQEKNIKKSYLIGGVNQIAASLVNQFPNAERIAGIDRYETNINVLKKFKSELDFSQLYVASGVKYADALSGSVVSASKKAPLVLTGKSISKNTENFLNEQMKSSTKITAFGGVKSVSQDIVNKIKNIAKNKNNSGGGSFKVTNKAQDVYNREQLENAMNDDAIEVINIKAFIEGDILVKKGIKIISKFKGEKYINVKIDTEEPVELEGYYDNVELKHNLTKLKLNTNKINKIIGSKMTQNIEILNGNKFNLEGILGEVKINKKDVTLTGNVNIKNIITNVDTDINISGKVIQIKSNSNFKIGQNLQIEKIELLKNNKIKFIEILLNSNVERINTQKQLILKGNSTINELKVSENISGDFNLEKDENILINTIYNESDKLIKINNKKVNFIKKEKMPKNLSVEITNNGGKINGTDLNMEYSTDLVNWIPCVDKSTLVKSDDYYVRNKATENTEASDFVKIAVSIISNKDLRMLIVACLNSDNMRIEGSKWNEQDPLNYIPKIEDLKKLKKIYTYKAPTESNLSTFDSFEGLQYAENLETLNFSSQNIKNVSNLKNLKNLKNINLSGNKINDIDDFGDFKNLKKLNLNKNNIKNINDLGKAISLEELELNSNDISSIKFLKNLTNLKKLSIAENNLKNLSGIENLINLNELYLYHNKIENINSLKNLENLTKLVIYENSISDLKPLSKLFKLEYLGIMNNKLKDVKPLENLTNMKHLSIRNGHVKDISCLSKLVNLEYFHIYENDVEDMSVISNMKKLYEFNFSRNKITEIPDLTGLTKLYWFYGYENQVKDLSPLVDADLPALGVIGLYRNAVTDISPLKDHLKYESEWGSADRTVVLDAQNITLNMDYDDIDFTKENKHYSYKIKNPVKDIDGNYLEISTISNDGTLVKSITRKEKNDTLEIRPIIEYSNFKVNQDNMVKTNFISKKAIPISSYDASTDTIIEGAEHSGGININLPKDCDIENCKQKLKNLPEPKDITQKHLELVKDARKVYNYLGYAYNSPTQAKDRWKLIPKELVNKLNKVEKVLFSYKIDEFADKINKLPSIEDLTIQDKDEIDALNWDLLDLTQEERLQIPNYDRFLQLKHKMKQLKNEVKEIEISDANLKKLINIQLKKSEDSKITSEDLKKLTKLDGDKLDLIDNETGGEKYRGIRDLTGLEYATNLEWIDLSENNITDLYPISNLKKLTWLELDRNYINDLKPLESLKMLKHLNIYNNTGITDLTPISNLTNLEWIDMHYCARDINEGKAPLNVEKLTNLKKLWYLSIETNTVDDISFVSQLPSLTTFSCNNTYVTDLKEVQDIACNAYLNWENPDCFFNMYNQKLKDSVKVNVDNGKTEYKFKSPVTNNEQYENKVESMALSMYGQKVDAPGFEVKEKPDYLNVDFDHSTNEIVLKFDENNDLKTREGKVEVFLDYGYYSLTIVFDTNQSGKESISVTNNSGTEIGQLSSEGKLTIKDGVTEIAEKQFYTNEDIKSVEIPSSVKKIGKMAFSKCNNLESVKLEEGLTTIGDGAFYKDVKLKSFEMPNSVDSMGMSVFKECKALESIKMSKQLTEIGTRTFYSCEALNNVIIPENVTTIGLSAFENCNSLKNITFSEKLITLSDKAFKNCDLLDENIDLKNILTIGDYVFSKCDGFANLPDLEKVTTTGEYLFSDCNGFENVTIPTYMKIIPESIFNGCDNLTNVIIPEGVTNICNYAFYSCEKLQSVKIPGTVETIGEHVFYNCVSLTDILIEDGVKNIQYGVFLNCSALKEINIPQSVELINEWALSGCKNLENINIDANNKFYSDIDGVLFNKDKTTLIQYLDKKGDTYEIPNTVKTIAKGAFTDTNIRNLTIPEGVETLIHSSFMDCHNIEEIVLPSSIKRIENGVFSYCDKLKKINLPETIDFLGNTLFSGCSSLETVKLPTNINEIGENMFAYCSNLTNIEIPENVTIIKSAAFSGCEKLTSVKIPKNVTEIEALAFEGCSNLDEVLIDNIEGNVKMMFNSFDKNTNIKYLKEKEVVNEIKSEEESNVNTEIVFE